MRNLGSSIHRLAARMAWGALFFAGSALADDLSGSTYCKPFPDEPPKAFLSPLSCGKAQNSASFLCRQRVLCAVVGEEEAKALRQLEKVMPPEEIAKTAGSDETNWLLAEVICPVVREVTSTPDGYVVNCPPADECKSASVAMDTDSGGQGFPIAVTSDPASGFRGGPAEVRPDGAAAESAK